MCPTRHAPHGEALWICRAPPCESGPLFNIIPRIGVERGEFYRFVVVISHTVTPWAFSFRRSILLIPGLNLGVLQCLDDLIFAAHPRGRPCLRLRPSPTCSAGSAGSSTRPSAAEPRERSRPSGPFARARLSLLRRSRSPRYDVTNFRPGSRPPCGRCPALSAWYSPLGCLWALHPAFGSGPWQPWLASGPCPARQLAEAAALLVRTGCRESGGPGRG